MRLRGGFWDEAAAPAGKPLIARNAPAGAVGGSWDKPGGARDCSSMRPRSPFRLAAAAATGLPRCPRPYLMP